ncbi:hypothetical protein D3C86_1187410 [compost metagenome]
MRLVGLEGQAQLEEQVLKAHQAQAHRPPALVGGRRLGGGVEVAVHDAIEEAHGEAHDLAQPVPVHLAVCGDAGGEIHRAQVAHGGLGRARDLQDLGAKVARVDHVRRQEGLGRTRVGGVLEAHPAVARLGEGLDHAAIEGASAHGLAGVARAFELGVAGLERLAPQIDQLGVLRGAEQAPVPVRLDPAHEEIGDPEGEVEVVGPALLGARVVPQLEEGLDVRVPGLHVDRRSPLALATLIHRMHRRIEHLEERHQAAAHPVVALDEGPRAAHGSPVDPDPARPLGEAGAVGVGLVDPLQRVVAHRQQVARGHLRVAGARVEEGR